MTQPSTIFLDRPTPRIATITFSNPPANLIVPETVIRLHEIVVDLSEDPDIQTVDSMTPSSRRVPVAGS